LRSREGDRRREGRGTEREGHLVRGRRATIERNDDCDRHIIAQDNKGKERDQQKMGTGALRTRKSPKKRKSRGQKRHTGEAKSRGKKKQGPGLASEDLGLDGVLTTAPGLA